MDLLISPKSVTLTAFTSDFIFYLLIGVGGYCLETEWAVQQRDNQRYTLDMVRIDNKIREVVNQIKQEEAKLANLANKIEDAAPSVSVDT